MVNSGIYDHPAIVNFMKRKGGRPEKIRLEQLTSNPDSSVMEYLKKEIHA